MMEVVRRMESPITLYNYQHQRARLKSYIVGYSDSSSHGTRTHSTVQTAVSLCLAGLIPSDNEQEFKCFVCNLVVKDFKSVANILAWHRTLSPNCNYLKDNKNSNICDLDLPFPESPIATAEFGQVITTTTTQAENVDMEDDEPSRGRINISVNDEEQGSTENVDQTSSSDFDTSNIVKKYNKNDHISIEIPRAHIELIKASPKEGSISLSGFNSERQRKLTFHRWPKKGLVFVKDLAASGFIYLNDAVPNDTVECVFCKVRISNWTEEMVPDVVHQKKSCYCPFMQGAKTVKNIPDPLSELLDDEDSSRPASDREMAQNLGIIVESAKHPEFAVETRRKATFVTWAANHKKLSSEMIDHQLFYTGKGDTVCCFSCGTEMSGWVSLENIWVRHARTSPHCQLVIQEKGQDYVDEVISELGRYIEPEEEPTINTVTTRMLRPRMDNPATVAVLNMRDQVYRREDVRNALIQNIKYGRADFMRQAPLVIAIMKKREEKRQLDAVRREAESTPPPPIVVSPPQLVEEAVEQIPMSVEPVHPPRPPPPTDDLPENAAAANEEAESEQPSMETEPSLPRETAPAAPTYMPNYTEVAKMMKVQLTCKICMDAMVGIAFLPCGHMVCCPLCAPAMVQCPLCRQDVRGTVRAYLDKL